MAKINLGTKEDFINDLRTVLYGVIKEFNNIYGVDKKNRRLALVDIKTNKIIEDFDESKDSENFNISGLDISYLMEKLYIYVTEGKISTLITKRWDILDDLVDGFLKGLESFSLLTNISGSFPLEKLLYVIDVTNARRKLDTGGDKIDVNQDGVILGYLYLKDIALLAGIDEKTARNLANPNIANRLNTKIWQGRTMVECKAAEIWLKSRGYQSTIIFDELLNIPIAHYASDGFYSFDQLSEYLRARREAMGLDFITMAKMLEMDKDDVDMAIDHPEIFQKELNLLRIPEFDITHLIRAAKILGYDKNPNDIDDFILAILKTIQNEDYLRIQGQLWDRPEK